MLNTDFFETSSPFPVTGERKRKAKTQERNERKGSKPFEPLNLMQGHLFTSLKTDRQTITTGPAGTGKTYVPARFAARKLRLKQIDKIYIARPTVSSPRHTLGFLPGKLDQKLEPWLVPIMDAFKDEFHGEELRNYRGLHLRT